MGKNCPRDEGGFCRIAQLGHPRCPDRDLQCSVTDPEAAWEELRQREIRKLSAKVQRQAREARR